MAVESTNVHLLTEEYAILARETGVAEDGDITDEQVDGLLNRLVTNADWTPTGASELVWLARRYGIFMLRNALALAVALRIEDGEGGF